MEHSVEYYKYVKYKTKYLDLKQELAEMHAGGSTPKQRIPSLTPLNETIPFKKFVSDEYVNKIILLFEQYHQNLVTLKTKLDQCAPTSIYELSNNYIHEYITKFNKQEVLTEDSSIKQVISTYKNCLTILKVFAQDYSHFLNEIPIEDLKKDSCSYELFLTDYSKLVNNMIDIHNIFDNIVNNDIVTNFAVGEQEIKKLIRDVTSIHIDLQGKLGSSIQIAPLHLLAKSNQTPPLAKSDKPPKRSCIIL